MYQHLNLENAWPLLRKHGLEVDPDTGALTLRKLPGPPLAIGSVPGTKSETSRAAGIAVGRNGAIYVSEPDTNNVFIIDPVTGTASALKCVGSAEPGWSVGQLNQPQGLAFQACRNRLLIADTENRRIQVVDPEQQRVVAVWGQTWPYEPPRPCGSSGGLNGPQQIACDDAGNVFVIDLLDDKPPGSTAAARVVKLTRDGVRTAATFSCDDAHPVHIAVTKGKPLSGDTPRELVFVLGIASCELQLFVFDTNGKSVVSRPIPLLGPDDSLKQEFVSAVSCTFNFTTVSCDDKQSRDGVAKELRAQIQAFTVVGSTAIVSVASCPPRVWCFEIGDAIENDSPDAVEPSWLPLYDGTAVALGVRGNPYHPRLSADVLLFAGPGQDLFALRNRGAYRMQGAFLAGPFTGNRDRVTQWYRLRFDGKMHEQEHLQVFTLSRSEREHGWSGPVRLRGDRIPNWFRIESQPDMFSRIGFAPAGEVTPEPDPDEFSPVRQVGSANPSPDPDRTPCNEWYAIPENQFDGLIRNSGGTSEKPNDQLWIFGLIASDGRTSPGFNQIRLENDEDGWLSELPEVYQRDPSSRAFVRALLALIESGFDDVTESIDQLPTLFSAHGMFARYGRQSEEVEWLRTALALPRTFRSGNISKDIRLNIQTFADGPYWMARRGTSEGLRRLVWLATGVEVVIDEPGQTGVPVRLASDTTNQNQSSAIPDANAPPVTTTTKTGGWPEVIGYSTVFDPDHPQMRLPDDLAHHFVVRGYESDLIDEELRNVVERTVATLAPAHNSWSVQVIQPRARVGVQARLGIDSVVARCHRSDPLTLDEPPGPDFQLDPNPQPPMVGAAHLGDHTILM